ncbi:hypothetical protein FYK55_11740 [Roseiconus nitratireducens]|uniref:Uncharacterized protein n=1 Tax=Roseiconus nitratireducens TaxID=2605748 RepID=A0A5M6D8G5_9BACT|nr:hypothetical protein [Roseiconus nitratireducens]KAA5543834.1 hypothetical protein FYK55_11740 [Roseiconus nitratireducens]
MNSDRRSSSGPISVRGPMHSVAMCPICQAGLCGIRICTGDDPLVPAPRGGFLLCDECEAIWMSPDVTTAHHYPSSESPECPICHGDLWGNSVWADNQQIQSLGWSQAVNPDLDQTATGS